jgi:hypothetical protein
MTKECKECKWAYIDPKEFGNGWFDRLLRWWYKGPPPGVLENLMCSHPSSVGSGIFKGLPQRCWQAREGKLVGCTRNAMYFQQREDKI